MPKRFKDDELSTSSDDSGFLPPKENERKKINTDQRIKVNLTYNENHILFLPFSKNYIDYYSSL